MLMSIQCCRGPFRLSPPLCQCQHSKIESIRLNRPNRTDLHALDAMTRHSLPFCGHGTLAPRRVAYANRTISGDDHGMRSLANCRCRSISSPLRWICERVWWWIEWKTMKIEALCGWKNDEYSLNTYKVARACPLFGSHSLIGC